MTTTSSKGTTALNRIVLHMEDPDASTRLYAAAALQNVVLDEALALAAVEEGAVRASERLLKGMVTPAGVPNAQDSIDSSIIMMGVVIDSE